MSIASKSTEAMESGLPRNFRKLSIQERRNIIARHFSLEKEQIESCGGPLLDLADVMVESAIGLLPIPLGIANGFIIDRKPRAIPMATEEPSVIAAASYGAKMLTAAGGISTQADEALMTAQIFLEDVAPTVVEAFCGASGQSGAKPAAPAPDALQRLNTRLKEALHRESLKGMAARGGGFQFCDTQWLPKSKLLRIQLHIDVRDAMGANILNTAAEQAKPLLEQECGGTCLMAILTNDASSRLARASFQLPITSLQRRGMESDRLARRIVQASLLAQEDASRAVTHNKGIMNGVTALALALGNDTRGLEAAVHRYAGRDGSYRGLSQYEVIQKDGKNYLQGSIELPVPLGTVGGAVGVHPTAKMALRILGIQTSSELGGIAAALGLAQNFAAISALVSEGIQHGHMRYHANRLAYQAKQKEQP